MAKKRTPAQRIERLESMVIAMGFLLSKINTDGMGEGMTEQIRDAVKDAKQLAGNIKGRSNEEAVQ